MFCTIPIPAHNIPNHELIMLAISVGLVFALARKRCGLPGTVAGAVTELDFLAHLVIGTRLVLYCDVAVDD
jgi:membrane-bound ClpP family serine protease